jgi:hypothetical protein
MITLKSHYKRVMLRTRLVAVYCIAVRQRYCRYDQSQTPKWHLAMVECGKTEGSAVINLLGPTQLDITVMRHSVGFEWT